jgi:hypothetical protein
MVSPFGTIKGRDLVFMVAGGKMFIFGGNVVGEDGTIIASSDAVVVKDIQPTNVSTKYKAFCANFKTNLLGFLVSPVPFDPCEIEIQGPSTIYTHLLDSSQRAFPGLNQTLHKDRLVNEESFASAFGGNNTVNNVDPPSFEPRVALVIGNANYEDPRAVLLNPLHDADGVAQALRALGFDVIELRDATKPKMLEGLHTFDARLQQAKVGLFYYAGHAVQYQGLNYLIPLQTRITNPADLVRETVNALDILRSMRMHQTKLNIMILDACRDNPFKSFKGGERGLAPISPEKEDGIRARSSFLLAFATQPGNAAQDGTGQNGTYTKYLLQYIKTPGLSLHDFFNKIGQAVLEETKDDQEPWVNSSPLPRFCFAGCGA